MTWASVSWVSGEVVRTVNEDERRKRREARARTSSRMRLGDNLERAIR